MAETEAPEMVLKAVSAEAEAAVAGPEDEAEEEREWAGVAERM